MAPELQVIEALLSGSRRMPGYLEAPVRCAVSPETFVYRGAYPVPYAVRVALDDRYGPGAWVHATRYPWRRYLSDDDPNALAKALTPEYPSEDSKYFPDHIAEMVEFQRRLIETMGIPPEFASYERAIACARRPAYSPFDGKYSAARAQRFLMDLYAAGMVSERMLLDAFGLDVSGRPE